MRTNLQIPIDSGLRDSASEVARYYGFSSLQDAVRIFLTQLSQKRIGVGFVSQNKDELLTPEQEKKLTTTYKQAVRDMKAGKSYDAVDADDLISQLNSS